MTLHLTLGLNTILETHSSRIVAFVRRQTLPTVSIITAGSLPDFKKASGVTVVGYFDPEDNNSHKEFKAAAELLRDDFLFGVSNDSALARSEAVQVPGIALYKDFDERRNTLEGVHNSSAITSFIKLSSTPLIPELLPELHNSYVAVSKDVYKRIPITTNYKKLERTPSRLHTHGHESKLDRI